MGGLGLGGLGLGFGGTGDLLDEEPRKIHVALASVAIDAARSLVAEQYGKEYLPDSPRVYSGKVKNAQEAHEAIRPAGHPFDFPEDLRGQLGADEFKLYDLIWKRTVASQMADARIRRASLRR